MAENEGDQLEIREGDLLAYAFGEASPEQRERIEADPSLMAEAAALATVDQAFQQALYRRSCPSIDDLLLYEMGLNETTEQSAISQHLAYCAHCQAELKEISSVKGPAQGVEEERVALWERLKESGRRIIPAVRLPQRDRPAFVVRGGPSIWESYKAGEIEIRLHWTRRTVGRDFRWRVEGRVLDTGELVSEIDLSETVDLFGRQDYSADIDGAGLFSLDDVASGHYLMVFDSLNASTVIVLDINHIW